MSKDSQARNEEQDPGLSLPRGTLLHHLPPRGPSSRSLLTLLCGRPHSSKERHQSFQEQSMVINSFVSTVALTAPGRLHKTSGPARHPKWQQNSCLMYTNTKIPRITKFKQQPTFSRSCSLLIATFFHLTWYLLVLP